MFYLIFKEIKPLFRYCSAGFVTLAKVSPSQKLTEYFRLEDLDDVQLSSSFDLKALQFCELATLVVYDVTFFQ